MSKKLRVHPILNKGYGWRRPALPHRAAVMSPLFDGPLPSSVDLRPNCPGIYDQGNLGSCFPAKTPILMSDLTEREIQDIGEGNSVITHLGRSKKVSRLYKKSYSGNLISVKVKGIDYYLTMTPEHPVATFSNKVGEEINWRKAQDLKPKDYVLLPNFNIKEESNQFISIEKYMIKDLWTHDDKIRIAHAPKQHTINKIIKVDEKFARLIGLFLAEGSYRKSMNGDINSICFTFNRKETNYQKFVQKTLDEVFDVNSYIQNPDTRPTVSVVRCDNSTLANFFHIFCGEYSIKKELNPLFMQSSKNIRLALLRGWLEGDGTQDPVRTKTLKNNSIRKGVQIEGVTSSKKLHRGMFLLSLSCGLKPSAKINKQQDHQTAEPRSLCYYSTDVITIFPECENKVQELSIKFHPEQRSHSNNRLGFICPIEKIIIKSVENIDVYNLEVEDDHTYVANFMAVHNCTSQALAGLAEFITMKENKPAFVPSRLFIYYNERAMEGSIKEDAGASLSDGAAVISKQGCPNESIWWYNTGNNAKNTPVFTLKPNQKVYADGLKHLVGGVARVNQNLNDMRKVLASGYPIVGGFTVYDSFESDAATKTGIIPMPGKNESVLGGHAICIVGYDDAKQWFIVRNSWGVSWGDQGYCFMKYQYWLDPNLSDDFWSGIHIN